MTNFSQKVLVLDSRFEPIKVVSLHHAFVLLYSHRAECVVDSDRVIQGVSKKWTVPWIVRLRGCKPRTKRGGGPRFSRQNIYLRDGFRCQYCHWTGPVASLTLDHLVPTAKGGKTSWDNIVTACKPCNMKKGAKTIEEMGLLMRRPPQKPDIHPSLLFPVRFGLTLKNTPEPWLPYLNLSLAEKVLVEMDAAPQFDDVLPLYRVSA
jgi:5-methylcytosine-specific restriction endonuclease McrA